MTVGIKPTSGQQLIDGDYVNGVAAGLNATTQSGVTAAGTNQATAFPITAGAALVSVDTVASSTGINLPSALAGIEISIYNNGANTLNVFPAVANNPITAAQDTINNSTSTTIASHVSKVVYCPKNGIWAAQ